MARRQSFKRSNMAIRQCLKRAVQCSVLWALLLTCVMVFLLKYNTIGADWPLSLIDGRGRSSLAPKLFSDPSGACGVHRDCPVDQFTFFIQSGAAKVVAPKICFQDKLVLGAEKNNAGYGINVVVINGRNGETLKIDHFDMYDGDTKTLIEFLKNINDGSVVLMASYDDPATKLNADARKLIAELGSAAAGSLGFRDNWVFVGGKGAVIKSNFERHLKNNKSINKYEDWPEIIELQGCIPKYLE